MSVLSAKSNGTTDDDPLLNLAKQRRSVRRYTDKKIDKDILDKILKIGLLAPSSYGQNPVEFIVVEDKATLSKVASCKAIGAPSVREATAAIIVATDTSKGELWVEDSSVAASHILLAAEYYGIGACWNQIHLRRGHIKSSSEEICALLGIPSRYEVTCVIAMGYKGENKRPYTDRDIDIDKIHYGIY